MNTKEAKRKIMELYGGRGWASIFTRIRLFITAPFDALMKHIPESGFIVDLGCGYGIFANLLGLTSKKRKVLGVDLDTFKIGHAPKGISNVEFRNADITKIEIPPADCILLIHVLHHLDSYDQQKPLIEACLAKIKSGGKLIIAEIDRRPWWKFMLTWLADHLLYPGDKIYYRFPESMKELLGQLPVTVEEEVMHQGTPFSHISYICTKD
ncbi:MAG: methyltransferase domain-containing protein [Patescibacteria group bacterium]